MCRVVGVVAVLVFALLAWRTRQRRWVFGALACLGGFGLYLTTMAFLTGSPWSGFVAQDSFVAESSLLDLLDPGALLAAFTRVDRWHGSQDSWFDRGVFVAALSCCLPLLRRARENPGALAWALLMVMAPAVTVEFMGFSRYVLAAFPVFVGAALVLGRRPTLVPAVLGVSALLQGVMLVRQVNHHWVG